MSTAGFPQLADAEKYRPQPGSELRGVRLDHVDIVEVPRSTYQTTPEELRAAQKFVDCAGATNLKASLLTAQASVRDEVLAKFDHDLKRWDRWAAAATRSLES